MVYIEGKKILSMLDINYGKIIRFSGCRVVGLDVGHLTIKGGPSYNEKNIKLQNTLETVPV